MEAERLQEKAKTVRRKTQRNIIIRDLKDLERTDEAQNNMTLTCEQ